MSPTGAVAVRVGAWAAVVRRELVAQRHLFIAALALGLMAPVSVLFSSSLGVDAGMARDLTAVLSATGLGFGALFLFGFGALAPEVASGRLSFFLARPIPASSLWLGRLVARFAAAFAAAGLVLLPSVLLGGEPLSTVRVLYDPGETFLRVPVSTWHWQTGTIFPVFTLGQAVPLFLGLPDWGVVLVVSLATFGLGHFLGCAIRLRSLWTLLDVAVATVAALVTAASVYRFRELGALTVQLGSVAVPAALAVVVLLAA
ncbi:MAG: hypothetical protein AAGF23_15390, partial [Acidobacteriota bacterium]